jgi:hypothetical protein
MWVKPNKILPVIKQIPASRMIRAPMPNEIHPIQFNVFIAVNINFVTVLITIRKVMN